MSLKSDTRAAIEDASTQWGAQMAAWLDQAWNTTLDWDAWIQARKADAYVYLLTWNGSIPGFLAGGWQWFFDLLWLNSVEKLYIASTWPLSAIRGLVDWLYDYSASEYVPVGWLRWALGRIADAADIIIDGIDAASAVASQYADLIWAYALDWVGWGLGRIDMAVAGYASNPWDAVKLGPGDVANHLGVMSDLLGSHIGQAAQDKVDSLQEYTDAAVIQLRATGVAISQSVTDLGSYVDATFPPLIDSASNAASSALSLANDVDAAIRPILTDPSGWILSQIRDQVIDWLGERIDAAW